MSDPGPVLRAYRPSRLSGFGPDSEQGEAVRLANLELYILRARAGLPIFEESGPIVQRVVRSGGMPRRIAR